MVRIRGNQGFIIVSGEAQKLADFSKAADEAGILWKAQQNSCLCLGLTGAREQAARLLANLCFGPWEQRWLAGLSQKRYQCFNTAELRLLQQKAAALTQEDDFCWGLFAGKDRNQRLTMAFSQHLRHSPRLDLEGFWRFRMEGYREYLQTLLSIAADEVLSEQEDREYLLLLSGYMAARPSDSEIHVFLLRQGMYDICQKAADGLHFVEGGRLSGCEDMLLSSLVQLAPQKLCLHIEKPLPPVFQQMLQQLFGTRLQIQLHYHHPQQIFN